MSELHFNVERRAGIPWAISATVEVVATIREPLKVIRRKAVLSGVKAKLDTGCSHTVVPHQIIRELESRLGAKLEPIERRAVFVANRKEVECPAFDLMLRVLD